jgi:hypothetical protein
MAGSFIIIDPFGLIHSKRALSGTSEDFFSTELYLKNIKTISYNAFIFGNSKTLAFRSKDWQKYVNDSLTSFKFGCPGESINNIYRKMKLIQDKGDKLQYALIVLDEGLFLNVNNTHKTFSGPVYKHHWKTTGDSPLDFYFTYFKFYLKELNFIKYIDYSVFKTYRSYMKGIISVPSEERSEVKKESGNDAITNEIYFSDIEDEIKTSGFGAYYTSHQSLFSSKKLESQPFNKVLIKQGDIEHLKQIEAILKEEHTNYKVIISLAYDYQKINPYNLKVLNDIFGKEHVFDFSGKNKFSSDSSFFYESLHFRPVAGDSLLKKAYAASN